MEVEKNGETVSEPLVHKRFADPATSGLEFEVPKQTKWEIIVEKPWSRLSLMASGVGIAPPPLVIATRHPSGTPSGAFGEGFVLTRS